MAQGANDFRPEIEREPEELRAEIAETRSSLTDKLETLEERVKGTVETAQHKVEDTMAAVKRSFDIHHHAAQRPWLVFGSSVAAGFLIGSLRPKKVAAVPPSSSNGHANGIHSLSSMASGGEPGVVRKKRHSNHRPSLKARLIHQFEDEIALLEKAAIGGLMGTLREWLKQTMPSLAPQLDQVMNSATTKLGGEPVPSTEGSHRFSQYGSH